jgi:membrane AbrB-like protein
VASPLTNSVLARTLVTLALAACGGIAAAYLGIPVGWIAGSLLAVAAASLAGFPTEMPNPIRAPLYVVLGVYAGSGVSPATLHQMETWPASFAILGVSLIGVIAGSYWWLHDRSGWDRDSALLSSLPGALSLVMATAETSNADMKKVAVTQSIRVLILIEAVPLLAFLVGSPERSFVSTGGAPLADPAELALLAVAGIAGGFAAERARLPGGWMIGGLAASGALYLTGTVTSVLPFPVVAVATIMLGAVTGSRFRPGDLAILPYLAKPALVAFSIAMGISLVATLLVTFWLGVPFIQALLAFAPGALDALIIIAFTLNIDPAYVAAHHVVRFVAIVAMVPLLARWLRRR